MQAFIELIQEEERERYGSSYIPPSQDNPAGPQTRASPAPSAAGDTPQMIPSKTSPAEIQQVPDRTANNRSYEAPWTCPTCTLENPANFLCCDVCAAERPVPSEAKSAGATQRQSHHERALPRQQNQKKRPLPRDEQTDKDDGMPRDTFAFRNRTRALDSLTSLERDVNKRPLGWVCHSCGTFMETQWWTCSCCGTMKPSS